MYDWNLKTHFKLQKKTGLEYLENPDTVDYFIQDPRRLVFEVRRRVIGPPTPPVPPGGGSEANAGIEALVVVVMVIGFRVFISASEIVGAEGFGIGVRRTVVECRGEAEGRRRGKGENGPPWKWMRRKQGLHYSTLSLLFFSLSLSLLC